MKYNTQNIAHYFAKGNKHANWYDSTRKTIEHYFPHSECKLACTQQENTEILCEMLAVTSMNATLKSNVALFIKALYQYKNDLPFEGYLPVMAEHLELVRKREKLRGRKVRNFAEAIKGNPSAVVVDLWMMRAFGRSSDSPTKNDYDFIENYIHVNSRKFHVTPRQLQASIWVGIRGVDAQVKYCDVIQSKFRNDLFATERIYTPTHIYK